MKNKPTYVKPDGKHGNPKGSKYKKKALTPKQQSFVLNYMANGHNAKRAAIAAGYAAADADCAGWMLIHKNPRVEAEIDRLNALAYKKNEITAEWILKSLKDIAVACKMRRIEKDSEGQEFEKGVIDSAGANRALELLGKNKKLFIDTMELTKRTEFADMSDEDLLKIIEASKKNIK